MAKSHPARFDDHGVSRYAQLARSAAASYVLLTCLFSLTIILHNQYSSRITSAVTHAVAALDPHQWLPPEQPAPVAVDPNTGKFRAIGEYLARRYRVSSEMMTNVVANAHAVGGELKLDPMLILAVIAVESRFNPSAESSRGAKGLMQVIPRFHPEKFDPLGGEKVAFEPAANILVGARILKQYIRHTGDLGDALQMYAGATSRESENSYSAKVMLERDRLNQMLRQYRNQIRAAQRQSVTGVVGSTT